MSFVDFAFESCQLYLGDSLFCVVTFLLTSDIDGFGLEAMAEDGYLVPAADGVDSRDLYAMRFIQLVFTWLPTTKTYTATRDLSERLLQPYHFG